MSIPGWAPGRAICRADWESSRRRHTQRASASRHTSRQSWTNGRRAWFWIKQLKKSLGFYSKGENKTIVFINQ